MHTVSAALELSIIPLSVCFAASICVCVHTVAHCAVQVLPCDVVCICMCASVYVSVCTSNCFVPYGQTPAQMNMDPL